MSRLPKIIGRQVRRLRKASGWTQADLAEQIGTSLDMIGRIERGQASPSITTIVQLARSLDCEPAHLLMNQDVELFPSGSMHQSYSQLYTKLVGISDVDLNWMIDALATTLNKTKKLPDR